MVEFYLTPNEFQRWILSWNTLPGWAFVIWLCFFHIRIDMILSSFFFLLLCLLLRLLLLLLLLLILLLLITISIVLAASSPSLFPSSLSSPPRFSPLLTPPPFLVSFLTDPWRQHFYLIWLSVLLFYLAVTKERGDSFTEEILHSFFSPSFVFFFPNSPHRYLSVHVQLITAISFFFFFFHLLKH